MSNDTTVPFLNPAFRDEMTDLIRPHAQTAIRQAVQAELEAFLGQHDDTDDQGAPERGSETATSPSARCFRALDRSASSCPRPATGPVVDAASGLWFCHLI